MTVPNSLLDIKALARAQAHLQRQLPLSLFPRLLDNRQLALQNTAPQDLQPLQVDITFELDAFHRPTVTGQVHLSLPMICQRCLQPFHQILAIPIGLIFTKEDDDRPFADNLELMPIGEGELSFSELLEDDLLLSLPMVPKHDEGTCQPLGVVFGEEGIDPPLDEQPQEKPPNPFLVLQNLSRE